MVNSIRSTISSGIRGINGGIDGLTDRIGALFPENIQEELLEWRLEARFLACSQGCGVIIHYIANSALPWQYQTILNIGVLILLGSATVSNGVEYSRGRLGQLDRGAIILSLALGLTGFVPYAITLLRKPMLSSCYSWKTVVNGISLFNVFSALFTLSASSHFTLYRSSLARLVRDQKNQRDLNIRLKKIVKQFELFLISDSSVHNIFEKCFRKASETVPRTYPIKDDPTSDRIKQWAHDSVNNAEIQRGLFNLVSFIKRHELLYTAVKNHAETWIDWDKCSELKDYMGSQFDFSYPEGDNLTIT